MMLASGAKPTQGPWPGAGTPRLGSALRWPRREDLLPLAYYLVVAAVLAATGYPAWRIAVLAVAAIAPPLGFYFCSHAPGARRHDPRRCVNADAEQVAWWVVLSQSSLFAATGLAVAVTGAIRSPLLITFMGSYFGATSIVGDRRQTRLLLGATALGVCLLAFLPRAWAGPELASSVYGMLAVVSVLGVGALMAPVHAMMRTRRGELARAREEMASDALTRARTLEQIGSQVAHELKNPLTGVKALVQLGLRNPAEASSHERLEVVEREVTRMQEILQNYLSFTRPLQGVSPRRVELGPLVSDTLVVLSARADEARVRLYAQGDATLEADPRRLKEALLNLVANAIEATPPGGEVVVEVRPAGEEAEIVVRDTGRGMAAETLRRIGTPFFTTRDDGTGLGVVLARSVIAQHGGSLRYESEPGQGTRVRVTLPRVPPGGCDAACAARR
jgi:two-component system, NtrC family, sensor histidine kinase HydH